MRNIQRVHVGVIFEKCEGEAQILSKLLSQSLLSQQILSQAGMVATSSPKCYLYKAIHPTLYLKPKLIC